MEEIKELMAEQRQVAAALEMAGGDQIDRQPLGFPETRVSKGVRGNQIELGASVEKNKAELLPSRRSQGRPEAAGARR